MKLGIGRKKSEQNTSPSVIQTKRKKSKKIKVILAVFLAAVIAGGGTLAYLHFNAEKVSAGSTQTFQTVTKMDISNSIAVTGTIEANESRTVSTLVSDTKVLSVSVNIGDYVEAGDPICTFDTTSIQDKIDRLLKKMDIAEQQDALEEAMAQAALNRAQEDYNTNVSENALDMTGSARSYSDSERNVSDAERSLSNAETDLASAKADYEDAKDDYEDAKDDYEDLKDIYEEYYETTDSEKRESVLSGSGYSSIEELKEALEEAENKKDSYKSTMESKEDSVTSAERAVASAESSLSSAQSSLESAGDSYQKSVNSAADESKSDTRTIEDKENTLKQTELNNATTNDENQQQLEEYYEQLEDCYVTAPISGIITSLSVEEGDEYNTSNSTQEICVIQDDTSFKVTGTVDQYDIASVSENMTAVIKTDATGDDEFDGIVTFVAPTPESSSSSGSSSSSSTEYEVEISLLDKDSRLRLGMTAETSILTESRKGVLAVPYDCIEEDNDGNSYIYIAESEGTTEKDTKNSTSDNAASSAGKGAGKGKKTETTNSDGTAEITTKKVAVEKGLETDYYTEIISDEVSEGDKVLVPNSISSSSSDSKDSKESSMLGGMGGMSGGGGAPGGGAPGGGGGHM